MSETGEHDLDGGSAPERTVGPAGRAPATSARVATVYDDVRELLADRGWVQGRETSGDRLSITAAIDVVVGVDTAARPGVAVGPRLARSGRVRRHLCELAGVANLIAWNDNRERSMGDVIDLLTFAAVAFPDD